MGIADVVWMVLILGGAAYLLYRSVWKKKGHCQGCDNAGCSKRLLVAPAVLFGCLLAPAAASLAADEAGQSPVLLAAAEIYHTQAEKKSAGREESISKNATISGLIELEAGFSGSESDLTLATAQLSFGMKIDQRIGGRMTLLSEDGGDFAVDEAAIDVSESRWSARLGLQYLPFGHFRDHFITDPLTLELGETRAPALLGGFTTGRYALAAFVFNGDAEQAGEEDRIRDWGASATATPLSGLEIGASYLSDLADGTAGLFAHADNRYRKRVAGWSAFAVATMGRVELSGEVLGAAASFAKADGGGRPLAWNLELAFAPTAKVELAARAEGSNDLPTAAGRRYGVAASWSPMDQLSLSAEYLRVAPRAGSDESLVTARVGLEC